MDKKDMLEIGYINNVRGLQGEMKVIHYCDDKNIFKEIPSVIIDSLNYEVEYVKFFKEQIIIKLKGIDTVEEAIKYQNKKLYSLKSYLPPLEDGRYYIVDIIGFEIFDDKNEKIGVLNDVDVSGPIDILEIKRENGKMTYIPNIKKFVSETDIENKKIIVTPIEGLID